MSSAKPPFNEGPYAPPLIPESKDGIVFEGADIPEGKDSQEAKEYPVTREKLGDYLSNITKVNKYNITPGTKPSPSHHDQAGPPPVNDSYTKAGGNIGATKTFLDDVIEAGAVEESDFTLTGISEYKGRSTSRGNINPFYEEDGQGAVYKKGVQDSRGKGHTLLASVKGHGTVFGQAGERTKAMESPGDHPIQQKVATILKNNKFHPIKGSPYIDDGNFTIGGPPGGADGSMGSLQKTMGRYDPDGQQFLVSELQNIGRKLMIAGVGHGGAPALSAILPSLQQMGLPYLSISVSEFNAVSQTGYSKTSGGYLISSGGEGGGSSIGGNVRNELSSKDSYGHMNSYFETFSGTLPMGMITATIGSALALLIQAVVLFALLALTQLIPVVSPAKRNKYDPRTLPLGKKEIDQSYGGFLAAARGFLIRSWGIPKLQTGGDAEGGGAVHWLLCVTRGLLSFLGAADMDSFDDVMELTVRLADPGQAGYAASIFRVCNRDLEQLVNIGRVLTDDNQNVSNKIAAGLAIISEFGDVKSIRFLNLCAKIGDILIMSEKRIYSGIGDVDGYPANAKTRIFKSRIQPDDTRSVYSTSELPAAFLVPQSLSMATEQFALPSGEGANVLWGALGTNLHTTKIGEPGRLSMDVVKAVENSLDCEYMPFYFHDLRTNEIISFHAFLDSVSDDFSPEWNSSTGFGRMDAVQLFTRTTRTISAEFMVAAHNQEDFDYNWYCLNKLTTLIYPQWSPGTTVKDPSSKNGHIMPFSQVPTASPIVRLRIGDLVRSNYSRFNLARIFGIGNENGKEHLNLGGAGGKPIEWDNAKAVAAQDTIKKMMKGPPSKDHSTGYHKDQMVKAVRTAHFYDCDSTDKPLTYTLVRGTMIKVLEAAGVGEIPFLAEALPGDLSYKCQIESGDNKGKKIWATHNDLALTPAGIATVLKTGVPERKFEKEPTADVAKFFDPTTNAIVRNFENAGGRGLAGAITAFNIDYSEAPWNTGEFGSRAPLWAKVSITMAVIHDLPPGLDADGFNRAPIYPVGDIMNHLIGPDIHQNSISDPDSDLNKANDALVKEAFEPDKERQK